MLPQEQGAGTAITADDIKGAKLVEIENAGHMCMIERPKAVTEFVRS